jgi:hypothetical protein
MKLSNQALGALMMALQKSLMEQSDIVPVLKEFNFMFDPEDSSHSTLIVDNPPVIKLDEVEINDANTAFDDE